MKVGDYASVEGAREAAKNRKSAREAVAKAEAANSYLSDAASNAALAQLGTPDTAPAPEPKPEKVVGARFGAPLRPKRAAANPGKHAAQKSAITPNTADFAPWAKAHRAMATALAWRPSPNWS